MKFGLIRLISSLAGAGTGGGVGTFCLVADPGYFFDELPRISGFYFPPIFSYIEFFKGLSLAWE